MNKTIKITLLLLFIMGIQISHAQKKSRGVSEPGKIRRITDTAQKLTSASDIECTLSYSDPSGDNTLSEGERGTVTALVRNMNGYADIEPKLEITFKTSWDPTPRKTIKRMDRLGPWESFTYKSGMNWNEKLPSGTITYQIKVFDNITGLATKSTQIEFQISGQGKNPVKPVLVDVDRSVPKINISNTNGIAVVIGNQQYPNPDVPDVEYAKRDAASVKKYLVNMLGFRENNIMFIENAGKAEFERIFGTREVVRGKLYNWVKPNQSDVFIYYSGHGAPGMNNKKAYFMPSNCDPNYVQIDGYPLELFYQNLDKIPARSITIVLDACFSGGSQQGMLIKNASPIYIDISMPISGSNFNLFTSASSNQIASWYPEGNHSLFTYYFLRALRGEADGNRDRQITMNEVNNFIQEHVPYMASRLYGRDQTPVFKGNSSRIICRY